MGTVFLPKEEFLLHSCIKRGAIVVGLFVFLKNRNYRCFSSIFSHKIETETVINEEIGALRICCLFNFLGMLI